MRQLGHDRYHATQRDHVKTLSFCEMLLSGEGLKEWSNLTVDNISSQFRQQVVWLWHIPFFWFPHLPEMLITGCERECWESWIKAETWNPYAISEDAISEWIRCLKAPGGLRGCLETYRAGPKNGRVNKELGQKKLTLPTMIVGAPEFFGPLVEEQMRKTSEGVERSAVFEQCGHSLALEAEHRLSQRCCVS